MNPSESADIRWIVLRPSNVNLGITLIAPLCAVAVILVIEMPDWARAIIVTAVLLVASADAYFVRQRNALAISGFSLERRVGDAAGFDGSDADIALGNVGEAQTNLILRLRYRFPARVRGRAEVEGRVLARCYVSTYFASIAYTLPLDPAWRRWFPRVLPIWADGIDSEDFRRVRVLLKWR